MSNGLPRFELKRIADDRHWAIINQEGTIVHRYPDSLEDHARRMVEALNYIGFRYANEGLDYIDSED